MTAPPEAPEVLQTSSGEFPLQDYVFRLGAREWKILHTNALLNDEEETHFFRDLLDRLPYGVALWPSSIALAHEIAAREEAFRGKTVLELGAGTGLPGIVAATLGARVIQTDRHEVAMSVCRRNGERNGVPTLEHRLVDWTDWHDTARYDWIVGSDILYGEEMHPHLRRIFAENLAPGGRILISDPYRANSFKLLEALEEEGWTVNLTKWTVGEEAHPRPVGAFEIQPPK